MTRYRAAHSWATMSPMRTTARLGTGAALAVLALAGCTSALPAPTPVSPVAASPTTCQINYNGPPDDPSWLHVDCADTHWSMPGPWADRQSQYLEEGAATREDMKLTKALIVGGEGRAWISTETLSCVATRDLFDTEKDTRVRCHTPQPEPAAATSSSTAPSA